MTEGFCHHCRADVPARSDDPRPTCSQCGWFPLIPPTWGKRQQQWKAGTWEPFIPKPEGWVWKDPETREQELANIKPQTCAHCKKEFRPKSRVSTSYCGMRCKERAYKARRRGAA